MQILKPFVSDEKGPLFVKYGGFHTGVDIDVIDVFAIASGVVKHIGTDEDGLSIITIEFDSNNGLRYGHLKSTQLMVGSTVAKNDTIGEANRFTHFEYIKPVQGTPVWPVRVNNQTWYKHDPTGIILGDIVIDKTDVWFNTISLGTTRPGDYSLGRSDDDSPDPNEEP